MTNLKKKNRKYHTVKSVTKFSVTHLHDRSLPWLGTGTSINIFWITVVVSVQNSSRFASVFNMCITYN